MPRHARPDAARSRRVRPVVLAVACACLIVLAVPMTPEPGGEVLTAVSGGAVGPGDVSGGEPTPEAVPVPTPAPTASPTPAPSDQPPAPAVVVVPPARTMDDAGDPSPPPLAGLEGYVWPLAHPRLTLPFGPTPWGSRVVDGVTFHDGVDLATFCGDPVVAAHAGRVLAAGRRYDQVMGWKGDLGAYLRRLDRKHLWDTLPIVVVIDDGNGYRSVYAHFGRVRVKAGQKVRAGQLIGYEGATGRASGCHLHYSLFSPWETATFGILPEIADHMKLPTAEIARVDPLLVLPRRKGFMPTATSP